MIPVYIAIGSNLADPLDQVNRAIAALGAVPQSRLVRHSAFTAPRRWDLPDSLIILMRLFCWKLT